MNKETKLSAIYISEENAIDFPVRDVLDIILQNVKLEDIEEMCILDAESEKYFLVKDITEYSSLEEIVQPTIENGNLSIFDFDMQLKNGVSIFTHDNLTVEAPDKTTLFKFVDFIFREYHLDAAKAKDKLMQNKDKEVIFE